MTCAACNVVSAGRRKGVVAVLALGVLVVLVIVTGVMATQGFMEVKKGDSLRQANQARMSAEGGLAYMSTALREVRLPHDVDSSTLLPSLQAALAQELAGASSSGVTMTLTGQSLTVSGFHLPDGDFECVFTQDTSSTPPSAVMTVTGTCGEFTRRVAVTFACVGKRSAIFDFGVASRGKIVITGSAEITGVNSAGEACVLSTREQPVAIMAGGSATISGDLYVTGEDVDYVYLKGGGISIGGSSDINEIFGSHVFLGTQEPDFPPINTAQFASLAVNTVDASTDLNGTTTFNNIRIAAGTNPSFAAGTVINGIIYVESPNIVTFTGHSTINGMIATEDTPSNLADCQLEFKGTASLPGTEALPDTPEFSAVKQHTGTAILAPSFGVTMRGATNSINGLIAADKLEFIGNSNISGDVTGSIIGLKDNEMSLSGNSTIRIARPEDGNELPAGFDHPYGLVVQASSYSEPVP